jgi:hypothetical protein
MMQGGWTDTADDYLDQHKNWVDWQKDLCH